MNEKDMNLVKLDEIVSSNIEKVKDALSTKAQIQNQIKSNMKHLKTVEEQEITKL